MENITPKRLSSQKEAAFLSIRNNFFPRMPLHKAMIAARDIRFRSLTPMLTKIALKEVYPRSDSQIGAFPLTLITAIETLSHLVMIIPNNAIIFGLYA